MRIGLERAMPPKEAIHSPASDLAAEANHRIANSLAMIASLVRTQGAAISDTRRMEDRDFRLILEEIGGRIDTVARLHRLQANVGQDATVNLADYLRDIAGATVSALSFAGDAELRFNTKPSCLVTAQSALSLGLIVGELVTNSVKYAHPTGIAGVIQISCHGGPSGIVVEVSDDGVGLPEGLNPRECNHLGLRLAHLLADQLHAEIFFASTPLGLVVTVHIPTNHQ